MNIETKFSPRDTVRFSLGSAYSPAHATHEVIGVYVDQACIRYNIRSLHSDKDQTLYVYEAEIVAAEIN